MTNPPQVRPVKVRLDGDDEAAVMLAELFAEHLPALTEGRVQVGGLSRAYPNRDNPRCRRYLDVYIIDKEPS